MYQSHRYYRGRVRQSGSGFIVPAGTPPPSFPVNGVLDDFNRANQSAPPSANWTTGIDGGANGFAVTSNTATPVGDPSSMYWNASNFGPNVEVYVTLASTTPTPTRVYFRLQQEGTAGFDGYVVLAYSDGNFYVYRVDNGTQTQLGASIAQSIAMGDSIGASMVGSTITVYYKSGAGSWTSLGTRSDGTYTGAGKIGVSTFDSTAGVNLDNFGGGTI